VKVRLRNPDREVDLAGGRKIHDVLGELGINPDTVLVIRERELLTREDRVGETDVIEIRPVISGGSGNRMKCRRCKAPAVVELRRHNAAFCAACFLRHVREQVKRAIEAHDMFEPTDRILVAVSGGKDSLALWDVLLELGYRADGLYLGLGIGEYSERSHEVARAFARERDAHLVEVDLARDYGFDVPTAGKKGSRSTCAVCGLSKRYVFNRAAREGGYDAIATGHNLDDEAATLLGNTLRWQTDYIARQSPVLPAQGQAAVPALGARDRGVRVPARDRLRGGGVPARRRQHAAPLQGGDEPARINVTRDQGSVLPRVPRPGGDAVRDARRGPAGRVRALWSADDGQVLRVLPRAGADPG
jgi:sulfur carrier protein ThiS